MDKQVNMICENTGSIVRCKDGPTIRLTGHSWHPRRCYGARTLAKILPQESDYNLVSNLGEETGALMRQSPHQESHLSLMH